MNESKLIKRTEIEGRIHLDTKGECSYIMKDRKSGDEPVPFPTYFKNILYLAGLNFTLGNSSHMVSKNVKLIIEEYEE